MKRTLFSRLYLSIILTLLSAFAGMLTSCDNDNDQPSNNDVIWDVPPFNVQIYIVDTEGENLLSPDAAGNWMGQPFEMMFEGQNFQANWEDKDSPEKSEAIFKSTASRAAAPAVFSGLQCVTEALWHGDQHGWEITPGQYLLTFGEFETTENQNLEMQFLVPGRNTVTDIKVINNFSWSENNEPVIDRKIWVDGVKTDGSNPIKIVLPRRD